MYIDIFMHDWTQSCAYPTTPFLPMIELFRTPPTVAIGATAAPSWAYVQRGLQRNIERIQQYTRAMPKSVKSSHFLIRLLGLITVSKHLSLERYYANVDAIALHAAMSMEMTCSISQGREHRGIFYGPTTPEILIATDDSFNYEQAHANWEQVCAVRPLLHSKSDLGLAVPMGTKTSEEDGLAVILVNVPMLAVQYRAFLLAQQSVEVPRTINQFLAGYVLPNMLQAHVDICVFNRAVKLSTGQTPALYPALRYPFDLPLWHGMADVALRTSLDNAAKGSLSFIQVLSTLPAVYHPNQLKALMMPDIAPTRQCDWALVLTRLRALRWLFTFCQAELRAKNQASINQIVRALRNNDVAAVLHECLTPEVFFEAKEIMHALVAQSR